MTEEPFKTAALGLGWMEYCNVNNFNSGDIICFKFDAIVGPEIAVRVFKFDL
jgi:hypothetical protein